jgi:hypothetical protein
MPRRYTCNIEGLDGNWVEVSDHWTRREVAEYMTTTTPEDEFTWLRRKVVAIRLEVGETLIVSPDELKVAAFDDADLRLWGFVCGVLGLSIRDLRALGNASGRLRLPSVAVTARSEPIVTSQAGE